jgi:hypothetical protein
MERGESKRRIAAGDGENITYTIQTTYDILPSTARGPSLNPYKLAKDNSPNH